MALTIKMTRTSSSSLMGRSSRSPHQRAVEQERADGGAHDHCCRFHVLFVHRTALVHHRTMMPRARFGSGATRKVGLGTPPQDGSLGADTRYSRGRLEAGSGTRAQVAG